MFSFIIVAVAKLSLHSNTTLSKTASKPIIPVNHHKQMRFLYHQIILPWLLGVSDEPRTVTWSVLWTGWNSAITLTSISVKLINFLKVITSESHLGCKSVISKFRKVIQEGQQFNIVFGYTGLPELHKILPWITKQKR